MQLMQFADTQFDSSADGTQGQLMQAINQFGHMAMGGSNQKGGQF